MIDTPYSVCVVGVERRALPDVDETVHLLPGRTVDASFVAADDGYSVVSADAHDYAIIDTDFDYVDLISRTGRWCDILNFPLKAPAWRAFGTAADTGNYWVPYFDWHAVIHPEY